MSIQTRAHRVANATRNSYQLTLNELRRLRLRPSQDDEYIEVLNSRHQESRTCESCTTVFPVGVDKKGMAGPWDSPFCPACHQKPSVHHCARCEAELIGPPLEDGADFCAACESHMMDAD